MKIMMLFVAVAAISRVDSRSHAATARCSTGPLATQAKETFSKLVSDTSSESKKGRSRLQLPKLNKDSVTVVTNDSLCSVAAARHFKTVLGDTSSFRAPVTLIRVGSTRYVIEDGRSRAGEYFLYFIYDNNWQPIGTLTH